MPRVRVTQSRSNTGLLLVALVAWALLGIVLVQAALAAPNVLCTDDARDAVLPGDWRHYAMAAACAAAFVAGRFAVRFRYYVRKAGLAASPGAPVMPRWSELAVQAALVGLFALFTLALAYETLGLYHIDAHAGTLHPITTYTRCAIQLAPWRSATGCGSRLKCRPPLPWSSPSCS